MLSLRLYFGMRMIMTLIIPLSYSHHIHYCNHVFSGDSIHICESMLTKIGTNSQRFVNVIYLFVFQLFLSSKRLFITRKDAYFTEFIHVLFRFFLDLKCVVYYYVTLNEGFKTLIAIKKYIHERNVVLHYKILETVTSSIRLISWR